MSSVWHEKWELSSPTRPYGIDNLSSLESQAGKLVQSSSHISSMLDQSHMTFESRPRHLTSKRWTRPHLHPKVNVNWLLHIIPYFGSINGQSATWYEILACQQITPVSHPCLIWLLGYPKDNHYYKKKLKCIVNRLNTTMTLPSTL